MVGGNPNNPLFCPFLNLSIKDSSISSLPKKEISFLIGDSKVNKSLEYI
jgi:hypothetical protein